MSQKKKTSKNKHLREAGQKVERTPPAAKTNPHTYITHTYTHTFWETREKSSEDEETAELFICARPPTWKRVSFARLSLWGPTLEVLALKIVDAHGLG